MADRPIVLDVQNVSHAFGENHVLYDVNLQVRRGQIVGLVGPSGCGKSTLLRAIIGTHPPDKGRVIVYSGESRAGGREVRGPGRDRGIVYQRYTLFPFLTALENVAFGLMLDETTILRRVLMYPRWRQLRKRHLEMAAEYLERVGLTPYAKLYPSEMSGGMQQRVAIAQALIMKPEVLLLDEPFGALDEAMREDLQRMLLTLYDENERAIATGGQAAYTILIVTHELNEALYVGDRVAGLSQYWDWKSEGFGACPGATIVYDRPAPIFRPDDERDLERLSQQRREVREVVFNPDSRPTRMAYVSAREEAHAPA